MDIGKILPELRYRGFDVQSNTDGKGTWIVGRRYIPRSLQTINQECFFLRMLTTIDDKSDDKFIDAFERKFNEEYHNLLEKIRRDILSRLETNDKL